MMEDEGLTLRGSIEGTSVPELLKFASDRSERFGKWVLPMPRVGP